MLTEAVAAALGGSKALNAEVHSEMDLALATMAGISTEAASRAIETGFLKAEEFYELVIPRRTFERRREENQALTVIESDRLVRAVRAVVYATQALGTLEKAREWLRTSNRTLRGQAPMALLETDLGARLVERALGRMEHGVHS